MKSQILSFCQRQRSCSSGNTEDENGDCPVDAAFGRPMQPGCCKCGFYLKNAKKYLISVDFEDFETGNNVITHMKVKAEFDNYMVHEGNVNYSPTSSFCSLRSSHFLATLAAPYQHTTYHIHTNSPHNLCRIAVQLSIQSTSYGSISPGQGKWSKCDIYYFLKLCCYQTV